MVRPMSNAFSYGDEVYGVRYVYAMYVKGYRVRSDEEKMYQRDNHENNVTTEGSFDV